MHFFLKTFCFFVLTIYLSANSHAVFLNQKNLVQLLKDRPSQPPVPTLSSASLDLHPAILQKTLRENRVFLSGTVSITSKSHPESLPVSEFELYDRQGNYQRSVFQPAFMQPIRVRILSADKSPVASFEDSIALARDAPASNRFFTDFQLIYPLPNLEPLPEASLLRAEFTILSQPALPPVHTLIQPSELLPRVTP